MRLNIGVSRICQAQGALKANKYARTHVHGGCAGTHSEGAPEGQVDWRAGMAGRQQEAQRADL